MAQFPLPDNLLVPYTKMVPVTKADADLPDGICRGLLVGTGGTANLMEVDGTVRAAVPLATGYHPLFVKQVRTSGTATDIWARSEEHTSELQSLMRISYAVFCLKKKKKTTK